MAVIPGSLRQSNHAEDRSVRPGWRTIARDPFSAASERRVSSSWLRRRRAFSSSTQSSICTGGASFLSQEQPAQDFLVEQDISSCEAIGLIAYGVPMLRLGEGQRLLLYPASSIFRTRRFPLEPRIQMLGTNLWFWIENWWSNDGSELNVRIVIFRAEDPVTSERELIRMQCISNNQLQVR